MKKKPQNSLLAEQLGTSKILAWFQYIFIATHIWMLWLTQVFAERGEKNNRTNSAFLIQQTEPDIFALIYASFSTSLCLIR